MQMIVRNLNPLLGKRVKIYRVSADAVITDTNQQFTNHGQQGVSYGVNLNPYYNVSCIGAVAHAGDVDFTIGTGTVITNGLETVTVNSNAEMIAALSTSFDMEVTEIPLYVIGT